MRDTVSEYQPKLMKQFKITTSLNDNIMVVSIFGELDASCAHQVDLTIQNAIETTIKSLLIDCRELSYISSAGLGVFLAHFQSCRSRNISFIFFGMRPKIKNIFDIVGLQNIFSIVNTHEEAMQLAST